eukprot:2591934-Prymnesium_polylepis.1
MRRRASSCSFYFQRSGTGTCNMRGGSTRQGASCARGSGRLAKFISQCRSTPARNQLTLR